MRCHPGQSNLMQPIERQLMDLLGAVDPSLCILVNKGAKPQATQGSIEYPVRVNNPFHLLD